MSEFNIRSASIDVEQIMRQIRARVREKRGADYTEDQIRELANVKLERFLDSKTVRTDLVDHYRRRRPTKAETSKPLTPPSLEYDWDPDIIYRSSRGILGRVLYGIRRLLNPVLKCFFNPTPIVHALHVQQEINASQARLFGQSGQKLAAREELDALNYEVLNNLVVEMTRLAIDMKNHMMRVESIASRLDFDERRARALESVVQYRSGTDALPSASARDSNAENPAAGGPERRRRRRRRVQSAAASARGKSSTASDAEAAPAESKSGAPPNQERTPPGDSNTPDQ